MSKESREQIDAAKDAKKTVAKAEPKPMQLISFSEFTVLSERGISYVLTRGFKTWMKTAKKEPLRARTFADWDKLIEEYLKS